MDKKYVFIGVAWPYVNGILHIGHLAGYLLPADIEARFQRMRGKKVLMVSGSDCFGTPITIEADRFQVAPKLIADKYHLEILDLFKNTLGLSYDLYTKTDNPIHEKVVQDFFIKLAENNLIFIKSSEQYYSLKEKKFLPDRYVIGECPYCHFKDARSDQCDQCGNPIVEFGLINPRSNISNEKVTLRTTKNYYLNWPKLQDKLLKYYDSQHKDWRKWVSKETKGWLDAGLAPRAITRDLAWGVKIPNERLPEELRLKDANKKRIYVWFDAVIGYYSASIEWSQVNNQSYNDFWNNKSYHYYFLGKDNLVFHSIFWPGQLIGYNSKLHLPDNIATNMFLDFNGKKFSKSRGNVIPIKEFINEFGNDAARFYFTYIMPENRDTSFDWDDFITKNNSILVGNIGNFINRSLAIFKKYPIKFVNNNILSNSITLRPSSLIQSMSLQHQI